MFVTPMLLSGVGTLETEATKPLSAETHIGANLINSEYRTEHSISKKSTFFYSESQNLPGTNLWFVYGGIKHGRTFRILQRKKNRNRNKTKVDHQLLPKS